MKETMMTTEPPTPAVPTTPVLPRHPTIPRHPLARMALALGSFVLGSVVVRALLGATGATGEGASVHVCMAAHYRSGDAQFSHPHAGRHGPHQPPLTRSKAAMA